MAIPTFNAVGFCAHYSKQGDWAFDLALELSKAQKVKLNVFHFLTDPFDPTDTRAMDLSSSELKKLAITEEKKRLQRKGKGELIINGNIKANQRKT